MAWVVPTILCVYASSNGMVVPLRYYVPLWSDVAKRSSAPPLKRYDVAKGTSAPNPEVTFFLTHPEVVIPRKTTGEVVTPHLMTGFS